MINKITKIIKEIKRKKAIDKENKRIIKFMQKNYVWLFGLISALGVILGGLTEYLIANIYFFYYGLDISLYSYQGTSFLYKSCISISQLIAIFSAILLIEKNRENKTLGIKKEKKDSLLIWVFNLYFIFTAYLDLVVIIISVVSIASVTSIITLVIFILINLLLFRGFEQVYCYFCFGKAPDNSINTIIKEITKAKKEIKKLVKLAFILVIAILLYLVAMNTYDIYNNKEYRMISDNQVIVYASNNYYLVLDCKIEKDKKGNPKNLIIYKGHQKKIKNDNIHSKLITFEKALVKEKNQI